MNMFTAIHQPYGSQVGWSLWRLPMLLGAVILLVLNPAVSNAFDVEWVEEYWELNVGTPDSDSSAPQVTMVMSPYSHSDCEFFLFTVNHHSHPDYAPGGMQIQHWVDDEVTTRNSPEEGCLSYAHETVTWVQRLSITNGNLVFDVDDGTSSTWGTFGNSGHLITSTATSLVNLNQYTPSVSVTESGVNYAGNRVSSLILTRLRWKTSDGQVHELEAPIDVDTDLLDP